MHSGERFNIASHLLGAVLALAGTVALVVRPLSEGRPGRAVALSVFGMTLVLSYVVSTLFHATRGEIRERFRKLDRTAIYLMILGGYTPVCLLVLPPAWGRPLLAFAAAIAAAGVFVELRATRGRAIQTVAPYLALGWMSVVALRPLTEAMSPAGVAWLVVGGVLYTAGGLAVRFRVVRRSHEVWHVAALVGSACHFVMMLFYVG